MNRINETFGTEEQTLLSGLLGKTIVSLGRDELKKGDLTNSLGRLIFKTEGRMLALDRGDYAYGDYFGKGPDEVYGFRLKEISKEDEEESIPAWLPPSYDYQKIGLEIEDVLVFEDRGRYFEGEGLHTEFRVLVGLAVKTKEGPIGAYGCNPRDIWIEVRRGKRFSFGPKDLENEWDNMVNKGERIEVSRYLKSLKDLSEKEIASVSIEGTFDPEVPSF